MGELRVGCAGWSYRDWVGAVYPASLPPSKWLEAYAQLFPIVEIDATFYSLPSEATVRAWVARARELPGFRLCAKVPQDVTHRALPSGRLDEAARALGEFVERVVDPLEEAGLLHALLLQLPPTYAYFGRAGALDALAALVRTAEALAPERRKVAVEFRHGSWYEHVGERLAPDVVETLSGAHVAAVQVDGLGSRFTGSRSAPWSYFRLHGRRANIPPSERNLSHAPYNYLYSKEEIGEISAAVRASEARDESTTVIFNNHYRGQSAHNAMDLLEALGRPRPRPASSFKRETRLDDFASSGVR